MSKFIDRVAWCMPDEDDKLIKLAKVEKTYDIGDTVYEDLKKANLLDSLEGKDVEVEVEESKDEKDESSTSGIITKLVVLKEGGEPKKETKKEDAKTSTAKEETGLVSQEVTVSGVSVEKAGVKLKQDKENKTWYTLDSTIDAKKFKDECTGKTVEINVLPQDKGNDIIKSYVVKEDAKKEEKKEEPKEEVKENSSKKSYNKGTGNSIEAQASTKAACVIVSNMVDKDTLPEFVEKLITRIAEHNFQTIQDLKNKKEL